MSWPRSNISRAFHLTSNGLSSLAEKQLEDGCTVSEWNAQSVYSPPTDQRHLIFAHGNSKMDVPLWTTTSRSRLFIAPFVCMVVCRSLPRCWQAKTITLEVELCGIISNAKAKILLTAVYLQIKLFHLATHVVCVWKGLVLIPRFQILFIVSPSWQPSSSFVLYISFGLHLSANRVALVPKNSTYPFNYASDILMTISVPLPSLMEHKHADHNSDNAEKDLYIENWLWQSIKSTWSNVCQSNFPSWQSQLKILLPSPLWARLCLSKHQSGRVWRTLQDHSRNSSNLFLIRCHAHRTLMHPQYPHSLIMKLVLLPTNLAVSVEVWMTMRVSLSWLLNRSLVCNLFSILLSNTDHIYFRGTQENLALPYICIFQTWCYPPVPRRPTMPLLCLCCFQVQTAHGWCPPLPRLQR